MVDFQHVVSAYRVTSFLPLSTRLPPAIGFVFAVMTSFPPLFDRVLALTGPTASGKTELALRVAERIAEEGTRSGLEIISLDSIAIYRDMDIGSAKPSVGERERVPHHMIDVVDPSEEFSVAAYLAAVHRCVAEIEDRGNRAFFVGGTPMYLKAILRGFDPGPAADEEFRSAVMADVEKFGVAALRQRLRQVDPLSAMRIDPSDVRRMIRALEVKRQTGVPMSHRQTQFDIENDAADGFVFALKTPREVLHRRIETRVEQMFSNGLIEEVQHLCQRYGTLSKTARIGVGYREILEAMEREGDGFDRKAAAEQVLFHTRRLARRQETWFRSFGEIRSIETHPDGQARDIDELVQEITTAIIPSDANPTE